MVQRQAADNKCSNTLYNLNLLGKQKQNNSGTKWQQNNILTHLRHRLIFDVSNFPKLVNLYTPLYSAMRVRHYTILLTTHKNSGT